MEEERQDNQIGEPEGNPEPDIAKHRERRVRIYTIRAIILIAVIVGAALLAQEVWAPEETPAPQVPIPEGVPGRVPGTIVKEVGTGREFISNQIIVGFAAGVSEFKAAEIIRSVDGIILQRFTSVPLFLIEVPDSKDGSTAKRIISQLLKDDRIDDAMLNYLEAITQTGTSTNTLR